MSADPIDLLTTTLRRTQEVVDATAPALAGLRTPWTGQCVTSSAISSWTTPISAFAPREASRTGHGEPWIPERTGAAPFAQAPTRWLRPGDPILPIRMGPWRVRRSPSSRSTPGTSRERPANRPASTRRRPNSPLRGCAKRCNRSTAVPPSVPSMPPRRTRGPGNDSSLFPAAIRPGRRPASRPGCRRRRAIRAVHRLDR